MNTSKTFISEISDNIRTVYDINAPIDSFSVADDEFKLSLFRHDGHWKVDIESSKKPLAQTMFSSKTRLDEPGRIYELSVIFGFNAQDKAVVVRRLLEQINAKILNAIGKSELNKNSIESIFK